MSSFRSRMLFGIPGKIGFYKGRSSRKEDSFPSEWISLMAGVFCLGFKNNIFRYDSQGVVTIYFTWLI